VKRRRRARDVRGFSLIELVLVVAILAILGGIAVPTITSMMAGMRVSSAARLVERELQTARMRAVSANRAMRVRFNCPAVGQYRLVEVIGTPSVPAPADADGQAATRCNETSYPYPDSDTSWFTAPNYDGPLNRLDSNVVFVAVRTLEFWPDGTVHADTGAGNPWPAVAPNAPVTLRLQQAKGTTIAKAATERRIQVNGVGKITLQ
jgi:prepilin-type N-terminal cleavage/methylation domain-containing protein